MVGDDCYYWQNDEVHYLDIARYVTGGDPFVEQVVSGAADLLERTTDGRHASFASAVDDPEPAIRRAAVEAIYQHLRQSYHIRYEIERGFDEATGCQILRRAWAVGKWQRGTCIDLTLFLLSCLANIGLWPVYLHFRGRFDHAVAGTWLQEPNEADPLLSEDEVRKFVEANRLFLIESTGLAKGVPGRPHKLEFGEAVSAAEGLLADAGFRFRFAVDVSAARRLGIRPSNFPNDLEENETSTAVVAPRTEQRVRGKASCLTAPRQLTGVVVVINADFERWSEQQWQSMHRHLVGLLGEGAKVELQGTYKGSVKLFLQLAPAAAERLLDLAKRRRLAHLQIVDARRWQAVCPYCFSRFLPEKINWTPAHPRLLGGATLAADSSQASMLTSPPVGDEPVDVGAVLHQPACPSCKLTIPRAFLDSEPVFVTVFGAPGSGKSVFLASMTRQLDETLARRLDAQVEFDPGSIPAFLDYDRRLVADRDSGWSQAGGKSTGPIIMTVRRHDGSRGVGVCIYEHSHESLMTSLPRHESASAREPASAHVLFFVFDPTQEPTLGRELNLPEDPHVSSGSRPRQVAALQKASQHIRALLALPPGKRADISLVVVISKVDRCGPLLEIEQLPDVLVSRHSGTTLDMNSLRIVSGRMRQFLWNYVPEMVGVAEASFSDVLYVPVSALGRMRKADVGSRWDRDAFESPVLPKPTWADVPLLYALHQTVGLGCGSVTGHEGGAVLPALPRLQFRLRREHIAVLELLDATENCKTRLREQAIGDVEDVPCMPDIKGILDELHLLRVLAELEALNYVRRTERVSDGDTCEYPVIWQITHGGNRLLRGRRGSFD